MFILMFVFPKLMINSIKNEGITYLNLLFFVGTLGFGNWIYCLWFQSKFDKYSGALIWLIILNALYAPFYYYEVIIKKRPLKGSLKQPELTTAYEDSIDEKDYHQLMKSGITEVLQMWASKEEQQKLQNLNQEINLTEELFTQWNDYDLSNLKSLNEVFAINERLALKQFDKTLKQIEKSLKRDYPGFSEFIETEEWNTVNKSALETLSKLK